MEISTVPPIPKDIDFSLNNHSLINDGITLNIPCQQHYEDSMMSMIFVLQIFEYSKMIIDFMKNPAGHSKAVRMWTDMIISYVNYMLPQSKFEPVMETFKRCLKMNPKKFEHLINNDDYMHTYINNHSTLSQALINWCKIDSNKDKLQIFSLSETNYKHTYTLVGLNVGEKVIWLLIDTCKPDEHIDCDYSDLVIMTEKQLSDWMALMKFTVTHWILAVEHEMFIRTMKVYNDIKLEFYTKHTYEYAFKHGCLKSKESYQPSDLIRAVCEENGIEYSNDILTYYIMLLPDVNEKGLYINLKKHDKADIAKESDFVGKDPILATKKPDGKYYTFINPYYK